VFAFPGRTLPRGLARRIETGEAAGIVIFSRNYRTRAVLRALIRRAHRLARRSPFKAPLLVMVDQEGGATNHVPGPPARSALAVGQAGDPALARADGRSAAVNLRRLGFNVNLAPVADVARTGSAIEREERSYGDDPQTVARLAGAFAQGLEEGGVVATLKHFPGFGAAATNTDYGPVRISLPASTLRRVDEAPFRQGIANADRIVMLSTAIYPSLDRLPAALSRTIATGELRGRLGFRGVSISDTVESPALARFGGPARIAVRTVAAGTDLLLFARTYRAGARAAKGLERAAAAGVIPRAQLEAAARRVLALRSRLR
jgi:beta-N-acetylhexosaminidase